MSVLIAAHYTQRTYSWTDWKAVYASKRLLAQFDDDGLTYTIWGYDGPEVHLCSIWKGDVPHGIVEGGYAQEQNDADRADFEANVKPAGNRLLVSKNDMDVPLVTGVPRTGTELIVTTPNFADPSTWYPSSTRVEGAALTDSGDGLVWTSGDVWIDMTHGKLFDEDALVADAAHGYVIAVTVDGVAKTEREPFATSGGDFVVDYRAGTVTFATSRAGSAVLATYSRMVDSVFAIVPDEGSRLDIEEVEAQFSSDIVMSDAIVFEIWVYNPADLPNKVRIGRTRYKNFKNFIDEALGSYPVIPAIGGAARGSSHAIYGFPFRYGTVRSLMSMYGIELRVLLEHDVPFEGEHATATFYTTVHEAEST